MRDAAQGRIVKGLKTVSRVSICGERLKVRFS